MVRLLDKARPRAPLTRRHFLYAGAAACVAASGGARGAEHLTLPRAADLAADRLLARTGVGRWARTTPLGRTARGKSLELISVGAGERSMLIVGAPHPNEPIGCLTIARLLRRLALDPVLREESGWQWHVVPAIDLDGLALNEGWFGGSLSVERYCQGFYRPPFALQPEYAFPLKVGAYEFSAATPENLCWQRALAAAHPHLQCSLHGGDSGGTWFLCSEDRPALFDRLSTLPGLFKVPLNRVGEPFSDMQAYRPGVLAFPAIEALLRQAAEAGRDPAEAWDAGDSSAGYAARAYGTLSLAGEVPLWDDSRQHRAGLSPYSAVDTLRAQARQAQEDQVLLGAAGVLLDAHDFSAEESALATSLREALAAAGRQPAQLADLAAGEDSRRRLCWADLVQYEPGTAGWRTPAMLRRLASLRGAPWLVAMAHAILQRRIAEQARWLAPVPLEISSGLQLTSILMAAELRAT